MDTTAVVHAHNMQHGGNGVVVDTTKTTEAARLEPGVELLCQLSIAHKLLGERK